MGLKPYQGVVCQYAFTQKGNVIKSCQEEVLKCWVFSSPMHEVQGELL